jgi:TolA-binding protein
MTTFAKEYEQSLKLISESRYEEALELLKKWATKVPNHSVLHWTVGLLEAAMGYPHAALHAWNKVDASEIPDVENKRNLTEALLPTYEKLYEQYNETIDLIQNGNVEGVFSRFEELLAKRDTYPLPLPFYEGYLYSLVVNGKEQEAREKLLELPLHVKNTEAIQKLKRTFAKVDLESSSAGSSKSSAWQKMRMAVAIVLALVVGGASMYALDLKEDVQPAGTVEQDDTSHNGDDVVAGEEDGQASNEGEDQDTNEYADLLAQIEALQDENEQLSSGMEEATSELAKQQELEDLISLVDVNLEDLKLDGAKKAYLEGLQLYNNGSFAEALERLTASLEIYDNEYFSDDSLFYAILATEKLGQDAGHLYDQFLTYENSHFVQSPYYDDVLLNKAAYLLEKGQAEEAKSILEEVEASYSDVWTGQKASVLLEKIRG